MTEPQKTILVAGGAGYIGGHVVRLLQWQGFAVVVLDNLSNADKDRLPTSVDWVEGPKGDRDLVVRTVERYRPAGVIDVGGYADIREKKLTSVDFYENNIVQTIRFAEALVSAGVEAYVFSSSAMVYGTVTNESVPESHHRQPITSFGRSMRACEDAVRDIFGASEGRYMILRSFNVAGAMEDLSFGQTRPNYYHVMTAALNVAFGVVEKVNAYGDDFDTPDGTGVMDYIHVQDLADIHVHALVKLLDGAESDTVNCGYGHGSSVMEVTQAVARASGTEIPVVFMERRGNFGGVSVLDTSKLTKEWGWKPRFDDLDTIVQHAYAWRQRLEEGRSSKRQR